MSTPTPRTFIYARQSVAHEEGVERQIARCRALAERRGWDVSHEFTDDGASASKARGKGTAWHALNSTLRRGDRVLAVDVDRLLRTVADLLPLLDAGAVIVTVDGEIDLSTADGEFRAGLLAILARFEVRRKSERQRRANAHRAAQGHAIKGRRLYGFTTDRAAHVDAEAAIVRRLYAHVLEGGSLTSAVRWLTAEGVPVGTGKGWTPARVRKLLLNPHYCGRMVYQGATLDANNVPAIVDADTWETVAAILSDPTRRTNKGRPASHWLSNRAACGTCGHGLGVHHGSYLCSHSDRPGVSIREALLDDVVARAVARALLVGGPDLFLPAEGEPGDVRELMAAYAKNEAAVREVLADRDEDLLPPAVARERLAALRSERLTIEADLEAARAANSDLHALASAAAEVLPADVPEVDLAEWETYVDDVAARVLALDLEPRRALVEALLAVQVDPGRGTGRVRIQYLLTPALNADAAEDYNAD